MIMKTHLLRLAAAVMAALGTCLTAYAQPPRIVNMLNFVRENDYRLPGSRDLLYDATAQELALLARHGMRGTFLVQYDALVSPRYQQLLKSGWGRQCEIGCWMEITQPQVEDAGLAWRGAHPWVSEANIGFLVGYTQEERKRLVDTYMEKFREVFGSYPKSVGSWYIDAWSLQYMAGKYGIVASCICRDQVGTDGYTLWGGYWNQAYYPSRRNTYMPAQTRRGRIDVPVFRMLGSDPIYQYSCGLGDNGQGVFTLEPVFPWTGRNRQWVERYLDAIVNQPCLVYNYVQVGQENAFTWGNIGEGLTMQAAIIDSLRREGRVRVETLSESGEWFRRNFAHTPPTMVAALTDTKGEGRKSVWYDTRFFRANVLLERDSTFSIRDIHVFDERKPSAYVDVPGTTTSFRLTTLPVVDGFNWSSRDTIAGLRLVGLDASGVASPLRVSGLTVAEKGRGVSVIRFTDVLGSHYTLTLREHGVGLTSDNPRPWALDLTASGSVHPYASVSPSRADAVYEGFAYALVMGKGTLAATGRRGHVLRMSPSHGAIAFGFATGGGKKQK